MDDIFERVHHKVGCPYISDLPCHPDRVWACLLAMDAEEWSGYPDRQMEDFSNYVFGLSYRTVRNALNRRDPCPPQAR